MNAEIALWLGLAASVLSALGAQANILPDSWKVPVTLLGVVGAAITGWLVRSPRGGNDEK
jgi:hypothetical protein